MKLLTYFLFIIIPVSVSAEISRKKTNSNCGDITEGEYTNSKEVHTYTINLAPGDKVNFFGIPVGAYLRFQADLHEPTGKIIESVTGNHGQRMELKSKVLSGRGIYTFMIRNNSRAHDHQGKAGLYELHIGCVKRDGSEVKPSM